MLQSGLDLSKIIFSDESRFALKADNRFIWYRKGEKDDNCFVSKEKFSTGIMVYGAIGVGYKSKLVACSNGVNAIEYRDILTKSEMFDSLQNKDYLFMQDGAPAHKSDLTALFLQKRCSYISCWPANSPDLNPIEHLWGAMKRIIQGKIDEINNKEDLMNVVTEVWDSFPQETIDRIVLSFTGRLRMIIGKEGESISDDLRSSLENIPMFPLGQTPNIMSVAEMITTKDETINDKPKKLLSLAEWTPDEDELLLRLYKIHGKKYSDIAKHMENRTACSIRNRMKHLYK